VTPIKRPIREPEVARIAGLDEPVLRNLWITTGYGDLGAGMARLLGAENVSWLAFATWASKTAGASIRGEQLPRVFVDVLLASPAAKRFLAALAARGGSGVTPSGHDLTRLVEDALADVSVIIARGNLTVFEELGPLFGRMVTTPWDAFLATVRAVDDDIEATSRLRGAFAAYHRAMYERDPKVKAELILFGNALCGLTEQTRLQPTIEAALDAPVKNAVRRFATGILDLLGVHGLLRTVANDLIALAMPELERIGRAVITAQMMRLALPGETLDLSRDVPTYAGGREFPDELVKIERPEVRALVETYDRTGGTGRHSGAHDWADLDDRMDYIVNLFRARQQEGALLTDPFTAEQVAAMQEGRIPGGAL
jgi:hypothetical protein